MWPPVLGGVLPGPYSPSAAASRSSDPLPTASTRNRKKETSITYEVTGSGSADTSYSSGDFDTADADNAPLPRTKAVTVTGFVRTGRVSATTSGSSGGTVSCRILQDGKAIVEDSDFDSYALCELLPHIRLARDQPNPGRAPCRWCLVCAASTRLSNNCSCLREGIVCG